MGHPSRFAQIGDVQCLPGRAAPRWISSFEPPLPSHHSDSLRSSAFIDFRAGPLLGWIFSLGRPSRVIIQTCSDRWLLQIPGWAALGLDFKLWTERPKSSSRFAQIFDFPRWEGFQPGFAALDQLWTTPPESSSILAQIVYFE